MYVSAVSDKESGVISLRDYIAEQSPDKPYRFVVIYNDPVTQMMHPKEESRRTC